MLVKHLRKRVNELAEEGEDSGVLWSESTEVLTLLVIALSLDDIAHSVTHMANSMLSIDENTRLLRDIACNTET